MPTASPTRAAGSCLGTVHERLLAAAAAVYSRFGATGATTRRIAAEASVNEVTLFRHFGSKEALLEAAAQAVLRTVVQSPEHAAQPVLLPSAPEHPHAELSRWCTHHIAQLQEVRGLLQHAFAEGAEGQALCNPHLAFLAMHDALQQYVRALREHGHVVREAQVPTAIAMLVSVLATDGMGRHRMERLLPAAAAAAEQYASTFLQLVLESPHEVEAELLLGEGWYSVPTPRTAQAFWWGAPAASASAA